MPAKKNAIWCQMCFCVIACGALSPAGAIAADSDTGIITFTGGVTGETCKISTSNGTPGQNMTLVMPVVAQKDVEMATIADGGVGRTPFDIELSGCTAGLTSAKVSFSSEQFADLKDGTLANDKAIEGGAENVNIALFNNGNSQTSQVFIGRPDDIPQTVTFDHGVGIFSYTAAYVPGSQFTMSTNPIIPGKIHTNATFSITYY